MFLLRPQLSLLFTALAIELEEKQSPQIAIPITAHIFARFIKSPLS
jgi:hypothetical protein